MNNNIGNMNSANPLGFNPQGHKASSGADYVEPQETTEEITSDKDILRHVPGDNYGRAMINKSQAHIQVDPLNIEDDIFTYQLITDFAHNLMQGYIEKGVNPQKAKKMTAMTLDVLLNPQQNS